MPVVGGEFGKDGKKVADEVLVVAFDKVAEVFDEFFFMRGREEHFACAVAEPVFADIEFGTDGGYHKAARGYASDLDGGDGFAFGTEMVAEFFLGHVECFSDVSYTMGDGHRRCSFGDKYMLILFYP